MYNFKNEKSVMYKTIRELIDELRRCPDNIDAFIEKNEEQITQLITSKETGSQLVQEAKDNPGIVLKLLQNVQKIRNHVAITITVDDQLIEMMRANPGMALSLIEIPEVGCQIKKNITADQFIQIACNCPVIALRLSDDEAVCSKIIKDITRDQLVQLVQLVQLSLLHESIASRFFGPAIKDPEQFDDLMNLINESDHDAFLQLIVKKARMAQLVLNSLYLSEKLNAIHASLSGRQMFSKSCMAMAIMRVLQEFNLLSSDQCNGTKELEIYTQIWSAPGKEASLPLVLQYLQKHSVTLEVYENTENKEKFKSLKGPVFFENKYDLEIRSSKLPVYEKEITSCYPLSHHGSDLYFIVVNSIEAESLHTLLLLCEEKTYTIFDPWDGKSVCSPTLEKAKAEIVSPYNDIDTGISIHLVNKQGLAFTSDLSSEEPSLSKYRKR